MALRPAFDALFAIDDAMAEVVATSSQPALGAIRLAWWREALERLDTAPPPPEPRLQAAAAELLSRGVTGAVLAGLEEGWAALLDEPIDAARLWQGGERLFAIGAAILGADDSQLDAAGRLYAQGRAVRRGERLAGQPAASLRGHHFRPVLRPLTGLARLAARDLRNRGVEPEATPGRAAALLAHRMTGAIA